MAQNINTVAASKAAGAQGEARQRNPPRITLEMFNTLETFNILKSGRYLVMWRHSYGKVNFGVAEEGEALLALPGDVIKALAVKMRPLDAVQPPADIMQHPKVAELAEKVGTPPKLRLFQYSFAPVALKLIQRLDTGAEFYRIGERIGPAAVVHVVHAFYAAYISNSGHVYDETPGGARAYKLYRKQVLPQWPQVYIHHPDKHRHEIGVRIPIDEQQLKPVLAYLQA